MKLSPLPTLPSSPTSRRYDVLVHAHHALADADLPRDFAMTFRAEQHGTGVIDAARAPSARSARDRGGRANVTDMLISGVVNATLRHVDLSPLSRILGI